jgi:predicted Zn-dependent peptidase
MKHTVSEITLKNGARGLLVHIPDASVMTFDINFRAGEYLVPAKKWEVPHLMEHVLLGANELLPKAREFQAELEKTVPTVTLQPVYTISRTKQNAPILSGIECLASC